MSIFEKGLKSEKILKWMGVLLSFSLIFVILVTSVDFHAFNKSYYESEYQRLDTAESLRMSEEGLFDATFALLDYLHMERDDIISISEVNGFEREIFNERETLHMVDVRDLYQNVLLARNVFGLLGIVALVYMLVVYKKQQRPWMEMISDLASSYLQMSFCLGIGALMLVIWALLDFTSFWVGFHELFFSNDLWMLNPATSIMINMFPEEFFAGMVMRISVTFIVCYTVILGLVIFYRKKRYKYLDKKI